MLKASTLTLAPEARHFDQEIMHPLHHAPCQPTDMQSVAFLSMNATSLAKSNLLIQQQKQRSKCLVHFDESKNKTFYHNTPYEVDCRWISDATLQDIRSRNKALAARRASPEFSASIQFLMHSSNNNTGNGQEGNCYHPEELPNHVSRIIHTNCRGLERWMAPSMSVARRRYQRDLLAWQRKLRKEGLEGTYFGEDVLREQSLSRSQSLRQFAFRMAQADEWEAKLF